MCFHFSQKFFVYLFFLSVLLEGPEQDAGALIGSPQFSGRHCFRLGVLSWPLFHITSSY